MMRHKTTYISLIAASFAMLALAGCQRESLITADNAIRYKVTVADIATKGTLVNNNDNGDYSDIDLAAALSPFKVAAYNGTTAVFDTEGLDPAGVETVTYTSGSWTMPNTYYWPQKTVLTFFAWGNLPTSGSSVAITSDGQTLTHEMVSDVTKQKDILLGYYKGRGVSGNTAEIRFRHPLTAVIFREGDLGEEKVTSITLEGLAVSGSVAMDADGIIGAWNVDSYTATSSQSDSEGLAVNTTTKIIGDPFILIPQDLATNGVQLTVTCKSGLTLETTIGSGEWKAQRTNWYTLNYGATTNWTLEVTPWDDGVNGNISAMDMLYELDVTGSISMDCRGLTGTSKLNVKSFGTTANSTYIPTEWYMEYWDDANSSWTASKPEALDWIAFDMTSGAGSVAGVDLTAAVNYSEEELGITENVTNTHNNVLRAASSKGTEAAPFDLSMHDIHGNANASGAETANCYVVSSGGWYAIPLVYGNAIKDGVANTNAYAPTKPSGISNFLTPFYNSKSEGITSPYIDTDLGDSDVSTWNAFPLWEDVANGAIISDDARRCYIIDREEAEDRGLTVDAAYLVFQVNKRTLTQGNVVLAVSNGNGIVWSWHIWATDNTLQCLDVKNWAGNTNSMMPVNLGWVDSGEANTTVNYPGRTGKVRIAQPRGTTIAYSDEITVERLSNTEDNVSWGNSSPLYQWGRKDPFIRSKELGNTEIPETSYSVHNGYSVLTASDSNTPDVKYPSNMYTSTDVLIAYRNRWNAVETSQGTSAVAYQNKPVKTIYDPCPPRFVVPQPGAFDGFRSGAKLPLEEANNTYSAHKKSDYELYISQETATETISIPACGYRKPTLTSVSSTGYYWTAVKFNDGGGATFRIKSDGVSLKGGGPLNAFAVRPITE